MSSKQPREDATVYSVQQLNRAARQLLEGEFPAVWVSGEISRFTRAASGHMYFDLKDADASISCAMFRGSQRGLRFRPASGQQVLLQGRVTVYEANGRYQIIAEHLEEAGEGLLRRQFEELKARLSAAGLFDEAHKQPLPPLPLRIGVITSPTGAAIRDILHILARRMPLAGVILYPSRVQGEGAGEEIAGAIHTANTRNEVDVLIVGRGGGSLEDLWCFNEEIVARAIHASHLPVVSAVGHEIDFTIADLVADVRAPTPSGAAEILVPDTATLVHALRNQQARLGRSLNRQLLAARREAGFLHERLQRVHPGAVLQNLQQRADELTVRLGRMLRGRLQQTLLQQSTLSRRLRVASPAARIVRLREDRSRLEQRLQRAMQQRLATARRDFAAVSGNLNAVSPLATLERGYAIVRDARGRVLTATADVNPGDTIEAQLANGRVSATVTHSKPATNS